MADGVPERSINMIKRKRDEIGLGTPEENLQGYAVKHLMEATLDALEWTRNIWDRTPEAKAIEPISFGETIRMNIESTLGKPETSPERGKPGTKFVPDQVSFSFQMIETGEDLGKITTQSKKGLYGENKLLGIAGKINPEFGLGNALDHIADGVITLVSQPKNKS